MKSLQRCHTPGRTFPCIITFGTSRNDRWLIEVSNGKVGPPASMAHAFHGGGVLDGAGQVTPAERKIILDALRRTARSSRCHYCIVWSPDDCTFIMTDGRSHDRVV